MATPQAVSDHYQEQQRLTVAALAASRRLWTAMTPDFDSSWQSIGARLLLLLTAAQLGSARQGAAYVPLALEQQGIDVRPDGQVRPEAFAGVASDGRPLDTLLLGSVVRAKRAVADGVEPVDALTRGGRFLDLAFRTQIADAAREAAATAIAARENTVWVRMVNPPCCSRCAILAGRKYLGNEGFLRHPGCDCRHIPTSENVAGDLTTDPKALFRAGQITDLSVAEREALDEGADLAQVVNARRGRQGITTSEGATRRRGQPARLTPAGIQRAAGANRELRLRLLREHGYLT